MKVLLSGPGNFGTAEKQIEPTLSTILRIGKAIPEHQEIPGLKVPARSLSVAAVVLFASAVFSVFTLVQALAVQLPGGAPPEPPKVRPAPTNLQVLPKNLTGDQVHEIMEQWEGSLGAHCNTAIRLTQRTSGPTASRASTTPTTPRRRRPRRAKCIS